MSDMKTSLLAVTEQIDRAARDCGRDPGSITLIGVSKRKSSDVVAKGIDAGLLHLGENYIQEAVEKIQELSSRKVSWHFIGRLQSNKARFAVQYFDYIHTVDSLKLAREIDRQAAKIQKVQKILVQVHIGGEDTKSGIHPDHTLGLVRDISELSHIQVQGLMCMPPYCPDPEDARPYFRQLAKLRDEIRAQDVPNVEMNHLSMGMSHDFSVAISQGATLVRVGTAIFGERQ